MKSLPLSILLTLLAAGCRDERYFGPYSIEVPTAIQERGAGRTFEFPLDEGDQDEARQLAACEEAEQQNPQRETPCVCDFPILTVREQEVRVDYRLTHTSGGAGNFLVWIGAEVAPDQLPPEEIPDLPRIEVLGEHHHHLPTAGVVDGSFLEEEMAAADRSWALSRHSACPQDVDDLPAANSILFGLALESRDDARVAAVFTFRIREW